MYNFDNIVISELKLTLQESIISFIAEQEKKLTINCSDEVFLKKLSDILYVLARKEKALQALKEMEKEK